jgi:hypothetical protein
MASEQDLLADDGRHRVVDADCVPAGRRRVIFASGAAVRAEPL